MQIASKKKNKKEKFISFLKSGAFSYLLTEALENILEEFIAISITTLTTRVMSFIFVFLGVQITKITFKGLWILIKAIVKKITYKEGTDKMEKIKNFFNSIKLNPRTTLGAIASFIASLGVGGLSSLAVCLKTALPDWVSYVIGGIIFIILFIATEIGVFGKGKEDETQILLRETAEAFGFEAAYDAVLKAKEAFDKAEEERISIEAANKAEEERKKLEAEQIAKEIEVLEQQEKEAAEQKKEEEQNKAIKEKAIQAKAEYDKAVAAGYAGTLLEWLSENNK